MNAVPEYFTVEPDDEHVYDVTIADAGSSVAHSGAELARGLEVSLKEGGSLRLVVTGR